MDDKEYLIPESVKLLMDKHLAAADMKGRAIKFPFWGFRRARKCAVDEQSFHRIFWSKVIELYPELKGKSLSYEKVNGVVTINKG